MSENNGNEALKWRFTVAFGRMIYEYGVRTECERIDSLNRAIISEYENQTGISARSRQDLIEAFRVKDDVKRQVEQNLLDCMDKNKKNMRKAKAWKTVCIVGVPVSVGLGVYMGVKLANGIRL